MGGGFGGRLCFSSSFRRPAHPARAPLVIEHDAIVRVTFVALSRASLSLARSPSRARPRRARARRARRGRAFTFLPFPTTLGLSIHTFIRYLSITEIYYFFTYIAFHASTH